MEKQTLATHSPPDKKNGHKPELATIAEPMAQMVAVVALPLGPMAADGGDAIQRQAARLGDGQLQTVQRRTLAAQIGRVQGNEHLQRVIGSTSPAALQRQASPASLLNQANQAVEEFGDIFLVSSWIAQGEGNEIKLTNKLFYHRHPDKAGKPIKKTDAQAIGEWRGLRDRIIRPTLEKSVARGKGTEIPIEGKETPSESAVKPVTETKEPASGKVTAYERMGKPITGTEAPGQVGEKVNKALATSMLELAETEKEAHGWHCTFFTLRRYIRAYLDVHYLGGQLATYKEKPTPELKESFLNILQDVIGRPLANEFIEGEPELVSDKKDAKESKKKQEEFVGKATAVLMMIHMPESDTKKRLLALVNQSKFRLEQFTTEMFDKKGRLKNKQYAEFLPFYKKNWREAHEFYLRWQIASSKMSPDLSALYGPVYGLCMRYVYNELFTKKRKEEDIQKELVDKGLEDSFTQIVLDNAKEQDKQIQSLEEEYKKNPKKVRKPPKPEPLTKDEPKMLNELIGKMKGNQTFGIGRLGAAGVLEEMKLGKMIETSKAEGLKDTPERYNLNNLERYNLNNGDGDLWSKLKPGMIMQAWTVGEIQGGGRSIKFAESGHSTMFIKYIPSRDGETIGLWYRDQNGETKVLRDRKTNMVDLLDLKKRRLHQWTVWFAAETNEKTF